MTQRKRILLVDDDRDFVEATTVVLESICEVEVAYGGNEGLAKARASRPDLILLDVIMPDKDGFAVCDQLKADPQLADVPVIMLTSLPDGLSTMGQAAKRPCVVDYLEKPVKPMELLRRVSKFLSRSE
jgi:two-component system, OmpR family, alkaline phosphatase synthesis response regulator PhoP